ncbi:MAG: alpha/beta fold hydrolase [Chlamydiota bacterium]
MPLIPSSYTAPKWLLGKHSETILPSLFRQVEGVIYIRERIPTPDGDFLDLDWSGKGGGRLAILSHGLEGSTFSPYILGMVKTLNEDGWDTAAWNLRGCSGELNLRRRFYHAGSTEDLDTVVKHAVKTRRYSEIILIGFSLGGNIVLKYLGENNLGATPYISKSVVFSVPCDLHSCVNKLSSKVNYIYLRNFLDTLKSKLTKKAEKFPDILLDVDLSKIHSFTDYDNYITAPLFGFDNALHYYSECSTSKVISNIRTPCLIVNAKNDPILDISSSPVEECRKSRFVNLEQPSRGGHLGFMKDRINGDYWSEGRVLEFLKSKNG